MWSVKCGVESMECGVKRGSKVWSVKCGVESVECKLWIGESVDYGV